MIFHSSRCLDYQWPHHPETPARVRAAAARLQKNPRHEWREPPSATEADILRVHSPEHLRSVKTGSYRDVDTPWSATMFELAMLSAGGAIAAAESALAGRQAFSLMRPPGHHAERNRVMGFCYFNNIAVAVAKALETFRLKPQIPSVKTQPRHDSNASCDRDSDYPSLEETIPRLNDPTIQRVAIVDFDCHHGNGTEDIFLGNNRVLFVSLHQNPCYPGTGLDCRKNCLNYPLPPGTDEAGFGEALDRALEEARAFRPQLIAVSAGFDAHKGDPITEMRLEVETFEKIGARILALQRELAAREGASFLPAFAVLEGGYGARFAACVEAFVNGWEWAQ